MLRIAHCVLLCLLLQGCAAAVVVGTGVAVSSATDRRTLGTQIDDNSLYLKVIGTLSDDESLEEKTNIAAEVINGRVLLVGQAVEQQYANRVVSAVRAIPGVQSVLNEIRLKQPIGLGRKTEDTWLTTKVKSQLFADERIPLGKIKVRTEDAEVFLIGIVTSAEEQAAVEITRHVGGVKKVVKVFENTK